MITQKELGERIAGARIRLGLTQEQVAESLGIPRTSVTQIENGNRQVSSLEIMRLSRLFDIDIRDLLEGRDSNEEILTLFRKRGSDRNPKIEIALKETLPICRMVSDLEDIIEQGENRTEIRNIHHNQLKLGSSDLKAQGQLLSQMERERLGLGSGPIPDLMYLILKEGIIVAEHDIPEDVSGIYIRMKRGRSFIILRQQDSHARKRFSLAHEYCHSLVDSHELIIISRNESQAVREIRANYFAASFLLPKEGIIQFMSESALRPDEINFTHAAKLAVKFGLSYEASLISLAQGGLISTVKRDELQKESHKAYGYMNRILEYTEPQFSRTTLKEWAFHKTIKALELELISLRKAINIARELGYDEKVVKENFELISNSEDI
ncbi:MAG: helix-turn-helix domain-containing protein [Thermoplasmataceae archaeon]